MRRLVIRWQGYFVAVVVGLLLGLAGCSDDAGTTMPDASMQEVDAPMMMPDAPPPPDAMPDATPASELRAGVVAVTEVVVTNPDITPQLKGARVDIEYIEPAALKAPINGTLPLEEGKCVVWRYDAAAGTDLEPERLGEGAVAITGGETPIGTCSFNDTNKSYECLYQDGAVPMDTAMLKPGGTTQLTWSDESLNGQSLAGMEIELQGFTTAENNGRFLILGHDGEFNLTLDNPNAAVETVVDGTAVTYKLFSGVHQVPDGPEFLAADTSIAIDAAAGGIVEAFSATVAAAGEGLTLADESAQPHAFPMNAAGGVQNYTCAGTNGACGTAPASGDHGFMLFGRTTDGDLTDLPATAMPAPMGEYAVFQCRGFTDETNRDSIELPDDAVQAIFGSNAPTRVEVRLMRVTGSQSADETTTVLVGHSLVGYTDI